MKNSQSLKSLHKLKKIGVDTNIFIYHFNGKSLFHDAAEKFFEIVQDENKQLFTSTLTLAEILSFKGKPKDIKILREAMSDTPNLTIVEIDINIAIESARIRRRYGFSLSDSIQIAAALSQNSEVFLTNDKRLKSFKEIPILLLDKK